MGIVASVRAKGLGGAAARVGTIASRFGTTAAPMDRYLARFVEVTGQFGARPTLPVTAVVLARHPALIRAYSERGIEFAIHGLVHNNHGMLGLDEQRETIARAAELFRRHGVPCAGFRGPYLGHNAATDVAVRDLGLSYHSSQAVVYRVLSRAAEADDGYRRALRLYGALDAAGIAMRPRDRAGLIDIPVAMPDDEIMVDRLGLDDRAQTVAWLAVLDETYARGDLFTVQLHPERIFDCDVALEAALAAARRRTPGVWIARLDELAAWWRRRRDTALSVDGLGGDRYRIAVDGVPEATLLVRGLAGVPADPWHGDDLVAREREFTVSATVRPVVGVSRRTHEVALAFLREEGWPIEVTDEPARCGAYVDHPDPVVDEAMLLAALDRAPGPLVRLWRWPAGARSALAVTGDLDSVTFQDFLLRLWETRRWFRLPAGGRGALRPAPLGSDERAPA